jgi:hypothetical protein
VNNYVHSSLRIHNTQDRIEERKRFKGACDKGEECMLCLNVVQQQCGNVENK